MLRFRFTFSILCAVVVSAAHGQTLNEPVTGRVLKVLPQLLDKQGRHTVSPSLFDRDAYQAQLRANPSEVSGIRYEVNWKARGTEFQQLTIRVELRGLFEDKIPRLKTLETTVPGKASMREWTSLKLTGEEYIDFGSITAWRATLWCEETLLDEYTSFLW